MIRRKHRKYNRVRPHQPPKGTSGKGMRTAPGPPWTKRAPRAMTLEEPPPEAAQEHSQSQPQPESQEEPKASQTESRDGGQGDRATAMAKTDAAMQNGPTTDELRDNWHDSKKTVNVQPGPKPKNEEGKNAADGEDQRKKESPAQLEGQSKIDDLFVSLLGGASGPIDSENAGSEVFEPRSSPFGALVGYGQEDGRAADRVPGLSLPGRKRWDESPAEEPTSGPSQEPRIEIAPLPAMHLETRERARERRRAAKSDVSMAATPKAAAMLGVRPGAAPRVRRSRHKPPEPPKPVFPRVSSKRKTRPLPYWMQKAPHLPGQQPRVAKQQRRRRG